MKVTSSNCLVSLAERAMFESPIEGETPIKEGGGGEREGGSSVRARQKVTQQTRERKACCGLSRTRPSKISFPCLIHQCPRPTVASTSTGKRAKTSTWREQGNKSLNRKKEVVEVTLAVAETATTATF